LKKLNFFYLGSDYPFPLGEQQIGQLIKSHSTLSSTSKSKMLFENSISFWNIPHQIK